ncbi:hypothetical protein [Sulfitobacter sp.]|uniref:hypothetical protein n=1 Tax=Sulfitobacter sp. TaxID=1903071 RepID=UPI0030033565
MITVGYDLFLHNEQELKCHPFTAIFYAIGHTGRTQQAYFFDRPNRFHLFFIDFLLRQAVSGRSYCSWQGQLIFARRRTFRDTAGRCRSCPAISTIGIDPEEEENNPP